MAVFHDLRISPNRRNNFLGSICLYMPQFVRKGEEALIYFPLEKKSFFSWVRGDIGLKVYYLDEPLAPEPAPDLPVGDPAPNASLVSANPPLARTKEPTPPAEASETKAAKAPLAGDNGTTAKSPEADTTAATPAPEDAPVMTSEVVPASEEVVAAKPPEEKPKWARLSPPAPIPMPRQVPVPVRVSPHPPMEPMEWSKHNLVVKTTYMRMG